MYVLSRKYSYSVYHPLSHTHISTHTYTHISTHTHTYPHTHTYSHIHTGKFVLEINAGVTCWEGFHLIHACLVLVFVPVFCYSSCTIGLFFLEVSE
jgi:hypothetical protein